MSKSAEKNSVIMMVDALNLFTRHFVAHPAVSTNGTHVGGVVGFLYNVLDLTERFRPTEIVIAWEGGGSTRRRGIYADYKSKRRPQKLNRFYENDIPNTVENRNDQVSLIVEILSHLPVKQIYVADCEADDVIGYLSKYKYRGSRKLIVSSDKDYYQLLDRDTIIYSPTWKKLVTLKEVIEKFDVSPENFCLAKAVCGDPADNIGGVKGVGFKTISKRFPMMKEQTSVEISDLVSHASLMISEGSKIKAYENVIKSESTIRRNWKLIYLDTQNLSGTQIKKINDIIETFDTQRNKMEVMKILIREGIQTFNVDRFFLAISKVGAQ